MSRDWEATFRTWAQAPGPTEREKCENAERAIRKAIAASDALSARDVSIFVQGSYANRTNVRQDSDVDVCVRCNGVFYYDLQRGNTEEPDGITSAMYDFARFRADVGDALVRYLGPESVTRGKKAFDVHANTYRVDADVVAAFEHRRYTSASRYLDGTEFRPDDGGRVINWPQQNYDNGVRKNEETWERFKALVRIMKRLRNEMLDEEVESAASIPSYLTECLVWNVPNSDFGSDTYRGDVRNVLAHLWNNTRSPDGCSEWGEVNELKYLFRGGQPWTREQVNQFLQDAWDYVGFT